MTLLGLNDGNNANTGHGYLDIVDFILQNCTNVEDNLQELYLRVAFNICIGNTDDHFRNHGFLLTAKDWQILATRLRIEKNEQNQFSIIFERNLVIYN